MQASGGTKEFHILRADEGDGTDRNGTLVVEAAPAAAAESDVVVVGGDRNAARNVGVSAVPPCTFSFEASFGYPWNDAAC